MEQSSKDVLISIALQLPLRDLLNLCETSRKYRGICQSEDFWRQKLYKDFKIVREKDSKRVYLEILQNKESCQKYVGGLMYHQFLHFIQSNLIEDHLRDEIGGAILHYLEDKILVSDIIENFPNYFLDTYNRDILPIVKERPHLNFITPNNKLSSEELLFCMSKLRKIEKEMRKLYLKGTTLRNRMHLLILQGIISERIPIDIRWNETCNYPLFFE